MALKMKRILCVFTSHSPSHLFSTLKHDNNLHSPFAVFATTRFNLSSADIARILKNVPSLDKPKTLQNVERFVHLLTTYGCSQHQIAGIMRSRPNVLTVNAEKLLQPKLQLLKDLGIEEKDLPKLLLKAPEYLSTSLQDCLIPNITFLKSIFQSQKFLLKAVNASPFILVFSLERNLRPSFAVWEGCGLQGEELARFLSTNPRPLLNSSLTPPKFDFIRKLGICKESKLYKYVLRVVAVTRMETLESRMANFREWGLSAEEIWELFRASPTVFLLSNDNIGEKMEFVVSTMELPPNCVVKHRKILRCSLGKVIKPRFEVFQRMKSLNRDEHLKSKKLQSLISMTEANFVNKILKGHPELETLYALNKKAITNVASPFQKRILHNI